MVNSKELPGSNVDQTTFQQSGLFSEGLPHPLIRMHSMHFFVYFFFLFLFFLLLDAMSQAGSWPHFIYFLNDFKFAVTSRRCLADCTHRDIILYCEYEPFRYSIQCDRKKDREKLKVLLFLKFTMKPPMSKSFFKKYWSLLSQVLVHYLK